MRAKVREWELALRVDVHVLEQITEHKCVYLYEREKDDEAQSGLFLAL